MDDETPEPCPACGRPPGAVVGSLWFIGTVLLVGFTGFGMGVVANDEGGLTEIMTRWWHANITHTADRPRTNQ